ncbi:MAG: hypothetical protein JWM02_3656 [Frankiales bacterium]|nr:hypothetical protein [Frankiales bacterium]
MTRTRVHLADAPTDVLVWLHENYHWYSADFIAQHAAPADADEPRASTFRALQLLLDMGYVESKRIRGGVLSFRATLDGRTAVADAQFAQGMAEIAPPSPESPS